MASTSVVCFDIGGTLIDAGPGLAAGIGGLLSVPITEQTWNSFYNLSSGDPNVDLRLLAERLRLDPGDLLTIYERQRGQPRTIFEDVLPGLASLPRIRRICLSNAARWLVDFDLCGLRSHFEHVFYSFEIGYAKPDVRAFRRVEQVLGVPASEILMVGDSMKYDYLGARAAGWQAVLLDRVGRYASHPPALRIETLEELRGVLEPRPPGDAAHVVVACGRLTRLGAAAMLPVPPSALDAVYGARPAQVVGHRGHCRAHLVRRRCGDVVLLFNPAQLEDLGIAGETGELTVELRVIAEKLRQLPPDDLMDAVVAAGLDWDALPDRDRHLAIGLVKEAVSRDLRQSRIRHIVESLNAAKP